MVRALREKERPQLQAQFEQTTAAREVTFFEEFERAKVSGKAEHAVAVEAKARMAKMLESRDGFEDSLVPRWETELTERQDELRAKISQVCCSLTDTHHIERSVDHILHIPTVF